MAPDWMIPRSCEDEAVARRAFNQIASTSTLPTPARSRYHCLYIMAGNPPCPESGIRPGTDMRLLFAHALLPGGWARDVGLDVENGTIAAVHIDAHEDGRERVGGVALPGLANLHSHAFQRGMAGLTEVRGPTADSFWSWRELMYRFLREITPEDVEALAAHAYVEMLESGFTAVGEFHYLHHDPDGRPYANLAEMAERIAGAASETGIGLTLPAAGRRRSGSAAACSRRRRRDRPAFAPRGLPETAGRGPRRRERTGPHPRRGAGQGSRGLPGLVRCAPDG